MHPVLEWQVEFKYQTKFYWYRHYNYRQIKINNGVIIGAGSLVIDNIKENEIVAMNTNQAKAIVLLFLYLIIKDKIMKQGLFKKFLFLIKSRYKFLPHHDII